jgi:hypothetical protein
MQILGKHKKKGKSARKENVIALFFSRFKRQQQ